MGSRGMAVPPAVTAAPAGSNGRGTTATAAPEACSAMATTAAAAAAAITDFIDGAIFLYPVTHLEFYEGSGVFSYFFSPFFTFHPDWPDIFVRPMPT